VQINSEIIDFKDSNGQIVESQIINNRTMVPLRKIFEELGCNLDWDNETKTITATKDEKTIILQIDSDKAELIENENKKEINLDSAPIIFENRTLVPLRFIAESLDKQVGWDKNNSTAIIIDYDTIGNDIKESAPHVYNILFNLENTSSNNEIKKYYNDLLNNTKEYTEVDFSNSNNNLEFEIKGTSEIAKEIIEEKWNKFSFSISESGDNITFTKITPIFEEILYDLYELESGETITKTKKELGLQGSIYDSTYSYLYNIMDLPNSAEFTTETYKEIIEDFIKLENLITAKNISITNETLNFKYLQFENIINTISNNSLMPMIILNKILFNYKMPDINDLMVEYSEIKYSHSGTEGKISLSNEYKQNYEYTLGI